MVIKNSIMLFIRKETLIPKSWWNFNLYTRSPFLWCLINHLTVILRAFYALTIMKPTYASKHTFCYSMHFTSRLNAIIKKKGGVIFKSLIMVLFQNLVVCSYCVGIIIWSMMNPNVCNGKPHSACTAQKSRPKYLCILKKVFMAVAKMWIGIFHPSLFTGNPHWF